MVCDSTNLINPIKLINPINPIKQTNSIKPIKQTEHIGIEPHVWESIDIINKGPVYQRSSSVLKEDIKNHPSTPAYEWAPRNYTYNQYTLLNDYIYKCQLEHTDKELCKLKYEYEKQMWRPF